MNILLDPLPSAISIEYMDYPMQLKLMCVKDGRQRLLESIFRYEQRRFTEDFPVCDGIADGIPKLYAYDMNLRRINSFYRCAQKKQRNAHLIVFSAAVDCFPRNNEYVEIRCINEAYLWQALQLSPQLHPEGAVQDA